MTDYVRLSWRQRLRRWLRRAAARPLRDPPVLRPRTRYEVLCDRSVP